MCNCGCSTSATPSGGSLGSVAACDTAASAIMLVDELGIPLANQAVVLHLSSGPLPTNADANGIICLNLPPGTKGKVSVDNIHEGKQGESTSTSSGQHFKAKGTGP